MTNLFTDYLRGLDPIIEEFHPNCSMTIPEEMVDKYFPGIIKSKGVEYTSAKGRVVKVTLDDSKDRITLTGLAVDNSPTTFVYLNPQGL